MAIKRKNYPIIGLLVVTLIILIVALIGLSHADFSLLYTKGIVAEKEKRLLAITVLLGIIVIIPVFVMTAFIAWRYRESNHKAKYSPEYDGNFFAEVTWWAIPCAIITTLAVITWHNTHSLDPAKQLSSDKKPLLVQVVALQWRWLFIYPEQNVASLNYVEIPANTPVDFEITSDAPMNSFWIPKLGGQIYAMPGMSTHLNLMANQTGTFRGSSSNISGDGFANMTFAVNSVTGPNFEAWVSDTKTQNSKLSADEYIKIAKPSKNKAIHSYSDVDDYLYDKVIMKYMMPGTDLHEAYHG
ncbi:MAG: ubiquinol oxidase subunit II [Candidatus Saccharimonadales bacterium]